MLRSIVRNITWLSAGNLAVKPFWFLFRTVACMNLLGAREFGVLGASLSVMFLAAGFADWGMTPYAIREVARDRARASLFFTQSALSVVAVGLGVAVGFALGYDAARLTALAFAGAYVLALALTEHCRAYYRAFEVLKYESVSIVVEKILVVALGLAGLWAARSASAVLAGIAAGMGVTLLLNVAWIHRRLAPVRLDALRAAFLREALPIAFPLGLASLFVLLYTRTDIVMLDAIAGETAAGQYDGAYRWVEMLILLPAMVSAAVYPRLSALFQERRGADFRRVLRASLAGAGGISLVVAALLSAFGPALIALATAWRPDADFSASGELLRLFAWLFPLMTANSLLSLTLAASDDQRVMALILGLAAAFNLIVNLLLIPPYGIYGACAATLLTQGGILLAFAVRYLRHTRVRLRASGAPTAIVLPAADRE